MKNWFGRRDRAREIHEEVESHLAMRAELNRAAGMAPGEAQAGARRQFGNAALIEEDMRRMRAIPWLESLAQDMRYGLRGLRRSPVFTATAVLTIALGIGASTAVFSLVDRILLRSLPYPQADRLVSIGMVAPSVDKSEFVMADGYVRWRDQQTPFSNITTFGFTSDCDLSEQNAQRMSCAMVESSFLPTFGIQPVLGRNFTHAEDQPNAPKVALLSYPFWKSRFGGDPGVVGRSISVDGQPTNIVGVLPRDFELFNLSAIDLLIPEAINEAHPGNGRLFRAFARLRPGVSLEQARAAMQPVFEQGRQSVPPQFRNGMRFVIRPLRDRQIGDMRIASWTLFAAVLVVLLIACANVANLMLARAAARRRELSIRAAIGAGRWRLARQVLTESLLLASLGAAAGCGLAWLLLRFFVAAAPTGILRLDQASLDGRVLLFAIALSLVSGVLFGLAPALEIPPAAGMVSRTVVSTRGLLRHVLIVSQIAASLVLLTGAGLLLRSLWNLEKVPLGIDTRQTVAAQFVIGKGYNELAFFERLETRLRSLPGSLSYGISDTIPPYGGSRSRPTFVIDVEGRPPLPEGAGSLVGWRFVTPGYFAAMGVPIVRGRAFTEDERSATEMPIILSQELARRLFPDGDAVGRHVLSTDAGVWHTVVGVAGDVINNGLDHHPEPEYYELRKHFADATYNNRAPQTGWRSANVIVRTTLSRQTMAKTLRGIVGELDPGIPVTVQTLEERAGNLTITPRFDALLLGGFGGVGLLLAAIGIYGVIAFLVGQRTREVGVRMALGATPTVVIHMFLRHAAVWTLAGVALGLAGSLAVTRLVSGLLFQVDSRDPWSLAAPPVLLLTVALMAAWLPARRAARIDPVRTLRED